MVNRYNQEKKRKSGQKKLVESFLNTTSVGHLVLGGGMAGGGRGFRREGVGVRDGARVG